jgi:hypothetical protein
MLRTLRAPTRGRTVPRRRLQRVISMDWTLAVAALVLIGVAALAAVI